MNCKLSQGVTFLSRDESLRFRFLSISPKYDFPQGIRVIHYQQSKTNNPKSIGQYLEKEDNSIVSRRKKDYRFYLMLTFPHSRRKTFLD
jgi:hypothetical protein